MWLLINVLYKQKMFKDSFLVAVTVLIHGNVCLLIIIRHLVVEAVLRVLIKCLAESACADLGDLVGGRITESNDLGRGHSHGGTKEQKAVKLNKRS